MILNPKARVQSYVDRRLDDLRQDLEASHRLQAERFEEFRRLTAEQLAELRAEIVQAAKHLDDWGEGLAKLGSWGNARADEAFVRADSALARVEAWGEELAKLGNQGYARADEAFVHVDAWGEELAKLGHLGHAKANDAVAEAASARRAMEGLQQQIPSFTQRIGGRMFQLEERLAKLEGELRSSGIDAS